MLHGSKTLNIPLHDRSYSDTFHTVKANQTSKTMSLVAQMCAYIYIIYIFLCVYMCVKLKL